MKARLRPVVGVGLLTLYGLGTTVGAGIYALIGKVAGMAGYLAPVSFLMTALVAALSALTFAEMSARFPKAAGAALYVQQGFGNIRFAQFVGFATAISGLVSSAALVNGFYGYLQTFVAVDRAVAITLISVATTALAAWGVLQSLRVAAAITLVEVGGLVLVIAVNLDATANVEPVWQAVPLDGAMVAPVLLGMVLAFYAYIGFEDMVELAEEVRDVERTLPRAIGATLILTALLYTTLAVIAVLAVPLPELAASDAPMALLFERGGGSPIVLSAIALFAIINGALIQLIMASRVLYGLASRGQLPGFLARVNARTRTPLTATLIAGSGMLTLAAVGALTGLATATSLIILCIFAAVNAALWRLKYTERRAGDFRGTHPAFAATGFFVCTALVIFHVVGGGTGGAH